MEINGVKITFKIDSVVAHTIVSKNIAQTLFTDKLPLNKSYVKLQTYTKESLTVLDALKEKVFRDAV